MISSIAKRARSRFSSTVFFSTAPLQKKLDLTQNAQQRQWRSQVKKACPGQLPEEERDCFKEALEHSRQDKLIFVLRTGHKEHKVRNKLVDDDHIVKNGDLSCDTQELLSALRACSTTAAYGPLGS